jgi:PAS domain S-box-containing protein
LSELDATLSQISHTVLRARDREKLLVEVCQIAVRFGCFKLAWIAWLDPSSNVLVTVAKAGDEAGLVTSEFVRRFCGGLSAIQSAQPFVVDELSASRCASGCRDIAEQLGVRSFATYPIRVQNDVCGVLTVCKAAPCSLDDNEAHLLEELTLDLSFALNNFEIERQCREAERGLKHAQQRLQTVLEQALDGFYLIDTHGKLLEVNDAYCLMSGYTREELLQMHVSELESTENEQEVAAHIQRVISQGMDRFETSQRRKDGQVINIETSVKFQSFDGGRFFCFLRDITERKRAEQALRESEDRFRRVVEGAPVGILIQSGGVDRYVNPAGLAMFGEKTADQIVGHTVLERIHPEHRAAVKERLQILQEERRAVPFLEEKLLRPDGKAFDAEVSLYLRRGAGLGGVCP